LRSLSPEEREAAWEREPNKPKPRNRPPLTALERRIAASKERDEAARRDIEQVDRTRKRIETEQRIAAISPEAKAVAGLKKFKPLMANDAAAKPKRRRRNNASEA
jgi:hypothetical protein